MPDESKVLRARDFRWETVPLRPYKDEPGRFRSVTRQTLLGKQEGHDALRFETRYFELGPGGYSSLEHHEHPHVVVILRGRGEVHLDSRVEPIGPCDCVYVAPHSVHQFRASPDEALGFLCIVDRERDPPVEL